MRADEQLICMLPNLGNVNTGMRIREVTDAPRVGEIRIKYETKI